MTCCNETTKEVERQGDKMGVGEGRVGHYVQCTCSSKFKSSAT